MCSSFVPQNSQESRYCMERKIIIFINVFNYNLNFLKLDGLECVCEFTLWFGILELFLSHAVK